MSANGPSKKQDYLTEEQQNILSKKGTEIERLQTDINSLAKPLITAPDGNTFDWSKHVTPTTLSVFQEDSSWNRLPYNSESGLLKQKYPSDIHNSNNPSSSWKKMHDIIDSFDEAEDSLSDGELSPTVSKFEANERKTFGTNTMEEDVIVVKCKTCQRPILANSFRAHSETCGKGNKKPRALTAQMESSSSSSNNDKSKMKGIFSDDDDEDDDNPIALKRQSDSSTTKKKRQTDKKGGGAHNNNNNNGGSGSTSSGNHGGDAIEEALDSSSVPAKRPPSTNDKPEKKKLKKEKQKAKATPKQKAPLDLDKQCGVIQGPNNTPCTRSLTCKSHSMGAKRAVAGRSQPYDVLLSAYQKKAIGRPQSTGANASTNKGTTTVTKTTKTNAKKSQNRTASPAPASATGTNAQDSIQINEEHHVNSDEEVDNVMNAIRQSCPMPLAEKPFYFVKRRRQCYRLRDILLDTITPKSEPMAHSDSNSSLSSLYNNNNITTNSPSPLHPSQSSQQQLSQQQQQQPNFSHLMMNSPTTATMNHISQPSTGLTGPPLGMIGFSGSMNTGTVYASSNGTIRDT
ncbi:SCA7, zinc-binding domain-containing protein [Phascolomyces articulosus]|uniref:SCA7, zinc-binding domain-containing protein n=1 Tax=Phascolomyces articulosus TaxID=60185 RepID=A0AAD5K9A0_9FUNG|nr:SCA7, zinc-binding domain-containing protein [Phascolomyces articulosus]